LFYLRASTVPPEAQRSCGLPEASKSKRSFYAAAGRGSADIIQLEMCGARAAFVNFA
jgi:hypothetical protein